MEIYQWLFNQAGFDTSSLGYFLYVNGQKSNLFYSDGVNGNMAFETTLIEYDGNFDWVDSAICGAKDCLHSEALPDGADDCDGGGDGDAGDGDGDDACDCAGERA